MHSFEDFFKTELWYSIRYILIILAFSFKYFAKYIRAAVRKIKRNRIMKSLINEISQKYFAEAIISGYVSYEYVNFDHCFAALNRNRLVIIDSQDINNFCEVPLSLISAYSFSRKNIYENLKNAKKYVRSFQDISFKVVSKEDVERKNRRVFVINTDRDLDIYFGSHFNDYEFNVLAVKKCNFFKLVSELIPNKIKENNIWM